MNKLNCFRHALMAVVAVTISSSVQAATGPYSENFNSQAGSIPVDNQSVAWQQTNGTWTLVGGGYRHTSTSSNGSGLTSASSVNFGTTFSDLIFHMSVDFTLNDADMGGATSSALRVGFGALGSSSNLTTGSLYVAEYVVAVGSSSLLGTLRIGEFGGDGDPIVTSSTGLTPTVGHSYRMTLSGVAAGASGIMLTYTVTDLTVPNTLSVSATYNTVNANGLGGLFGLRSNLGSATGRTSTLDVTFDNFSVSASPIPEPSSYAGIMGLVVVGFIALRRRG